MGALKSIYSSSVPLSLRQRIAYLRYIGAMLIYSRGAFPRECNACGFKGRFRAFGFPPRYDAMCPKCDSLERHRLLLLKFESGDLELQEPILHFAPEKITSDVWSDLYDDYKTADLSHKSDMQLNVEAIDLPESSIQTIVCSHVLEHVDDSKAIPELYRILKPSGTAILMVPIIEGWNNTYENLDIRGPRQQLLHFNQRDHIRYYARDFRERLRNAGFQLDEITTTPEECARYGMMRGERIFLARKP